MTCRSQLMTCRPHFDDRFQLMTCTLSTAGPGQTQLSPLRACVPRKADCLVARFFGSRDVLRTRVDSPAEYAPNTDDHLQENVAKLPIRQYQCCACTLELVHSQFSGAAYWVYAIPCLEIHNAPLN